jgi:alcohol dehydrogenase YqhD (iron-dependent ADH family)
MKNFVFRNPTKIIFGDNAVESIFKDIKSQGYKNILLLYGRGSIFKNGLYDRLIKNFRDNNLVFSEFGGIKPNPVLSKVKEGIEFSREKNIDCILAVGGGSVIDSAKAIAAGYHYDGDVWDFFERKAVVKKALPIFTILTISATGSEMNSGGVITNEKEEKKWAFGSPLLFPVVSAIDPKIQFSLPWSQTANGVIDAIAHVFELYFNGVSNTDIQDEIAEGIVRTLIKHSLILKKDPKNYESRAQVAWSATLALNGLNGAGRGSGDWSSHMIEHSLSAFYDIAHGEGLGIIFPAWMKYVYKNDVEKFARFSKKVFGFEGSNLEESSLYGIESFQNFIRSLDKPLYLSELKIGDSEIDKIAQNTFKLGEVGKLKRLGLNDIKNILTLAYNKD